MIDPDYPEHSEPGYISPQRESFKGSKAFFDACSPDKVLLPGVLETTSFAELMDGSLLYMVFGYPGAQIDHWNKKFVPSSSPLTHSSFLFIVRFPVFPGTDITDILHGIHTPEDLLVSHTESRSDVIEVAQSQRYLNKDHLFIPVFQKVGRVANDLYALLRRKNMLKYQ